MLTTSPHRPTAAKLIVPSLESYPAYTEAVAKLTALTDQKREIETAFNATRDRLNGMSESQARANDAAQRLLQNHTIGREQIAAAASEQATGSDLATLKRQFEVVSSAIQLQERVVAEQKLIASRAIVANLVPTHKRIAKRIEAAAAELEAALDEEQGLRGQLELIGAAGHLRDVRFAASSFGDKNDGMFARWRREHAEYLG